MPEDHATTVAHPTPETDLVRGEPIRFSGQRLQFEGENGDYMPVGSQNGCLLALSFRDDDGHHTYGSGVMVGPGLALCAAHVLHENDYHGKLIQGKATLIAQAPLANGSMFLWTAHKVAIVPNSDLAVLSMALSSPYPASRHFVSSWPTTRMPSVGEELTLTGFSAKGDGSLPIEDRMFIELAPNCTKGRVIDRYIEGRDRLLPGPCLAVDCAVPGGTSGGPVFDSRGHLVGLVSASYEGEAISFVSHIWPALVRAEAAPVWPPAPYIIPKPAPLLHLGVAFGVYIERPDAFKLLIYNGQIALDYIAWN